MFKKRFKRPVVHSLLRILHGFGFHRRAVLIVGTGEPALRFGKYLGEQSDRGFSIAGYVDERELYGTSSPRTGTEWEPGKAPRVSSIAELPSFLSGNVVDEVVFILPAYLLKQAEPYMRELRCRGIPYRAFPGAFTPPEESKPGLRFDATRLTPGKLLLKRLFDLVLSASALLLLSPAFLLTALLISLVEGKPVFFKQQRVGLRGRIFTLYKFRTMVRHAQDQRYELEALNEAQRPVFKITRDPRVTSLGAFLRFFSLDELPQLFNVLKGDMSIVGPRPALPEEVAQYRTWERRRLSVAPGVTCFWQVSGRSDIPFKRWMELDLAYIDNWSFLQDLALIVYTIPAVFSGRGSR